MQYKFAAIIAFLSLLSACTGPDERIGQACNTEGQLLCLQGATRYVVCKDGTYQEGACTEGTVCRQTTQGSSCVLTSSEGTEQPACTKSCSGSGLLIDCVENAPVLRNCDKNMVCRSGQCLKEPCKSKESCAANEECSGGLCVIARKECKIDEDCGTDKRCEQNKCVPVQNRPYLLRTSCSQDAKSVEYHYDDKTVTKSCKELSGYDTSCKVYGQDNAGCEMPSVCSAAITEDGRCIDDNVVEFCDTSSQRPVLLDCSAVDMQCAQIRDKAFCVKTCDEASSPMSCRVVDNALVVDRCTKIGAVSVIDSRVSHCVDNATMVTCNQSEVITKTCAQGEECNASLGYCTRSCSNENEILCEGDNLLKCTRVNDVLLYKTLGGRACDKNTLKLCTAGAMRDVDCENYKQDEQSEVIHGYCASDYPVKGSAVCVPNSEGKPCRSGLTPEGICTNNTLTYCANDGTEVNVDCSKNLDGLKLCTTVHGFSDCRASCSKEGSAGCQSFDGGATQTLSICLKGDDSKLSKVQAHSICDGQELVSCDSKGAVTKTSCELSGGSCEIMECRYPVCNQKDKICTGQDGSTLMQCSVRSDGFILGSTLSSPLCGQDGVQFACTAGNLQDCSKL